jgi:hypothetical protein
MYFGRQRRTGCHRLLGAGDLLADDGHALHHALVGVGPSSGSMTGVPAAGS